MVDSGRRFAFDRDTMEHAPFMIVSDCVVLCASVVEKDE